MSGYKNYLLASVAALCLCGEASAAISLDTTRVIYDAKYKEASLEVRNRGDNDVVLQSWLDAGDRQLDKMPFIVTPPLALLEGSKKQKLRIIYEGAGMPEDRESVMWLNVQEVPRAAPVDKNVLQLAIRQRIKLFYRPSSLQGVASEAPTELRWTLMPNNMLSVQNSTAFNVTLVGLKVGQTLVSDVFMLAPYEQRQFALKSAGWDSSSDIAFQSINDYGGQSDYRAELKVNTPVQAHAVGYSDS